VTSSFSAPSTIRKDPRIPAAIVRAHIRKMIKDLDVDDETWEKLEGGPLNTAYEEVLDGFCKELGNSTQTLHLHYLVSIPIV
jgi:hypothetical protein